jgi:hypothetical protein
MVMMNSPGQLPCVHSSDGVSYSPPPAFNASSFSSSVSSSSVRQNNNNFFESPNNAHHAAAPLAEPATQPRRNNAARPAVASGYRRRKRTPRMAQTSVTSVLFTLDDRVLLTSGAVDGLIKAWDTRKLPVAKGASGKSKGRRSKQPGCLFEIAPGHQAVADASSSHGSTSELGGSSCYHDSAAAKSTNPYMYSSNAAGSPGSSSSIAAADHHRPAVDMRNAVPQRSPRRHGISSMNLDSTGSRLLVSYLGIGVHEYQIHRTRPALESSGHRVYSGHRQHTFYIRSCFSPDDRHVLSGSSDGALCMWEAKPGGGLSERERDARPIKMEGHSKEVTACAWSQFDRGVVASCSDDSTIKLWRMDREAALPKRAGVRQRVRGAVHDAAAGGNILGPRRSTGSGFFRDRRGGHGYYYVGGSAGGGGGGGDGGGRHSSAGGGGGGGGGGAGSQEGVGGLSGAGGDHHAERQGTDSRLRKHFHMTRAPKRARVEQQSSIFRYMRRSNSPPCAGD